MKHNREILAIALPAIISNITLPVLSLVDVAITGHIGDAIYIGAIALGGTVFNMLYWLFNFLRMGTTGLTAQAYGSGDTNSTSILFYRSIVVGVIVGLLLLAFGNAIGSVMLGFMDADDATSALALQYFKICIFGAPAVIVTYSISGWFLGMQNSKAQMWMAIITNLVNIAVSLTLVFGFHLKIEGVATGTVSAQWIGLVVGISIVSVKYKPTLPPLHKIFDFRQLLRFFRVNVDIFLRTTCLVAVTVWFTHAGALQGTDILAANALLLQLFMLFSYFMDGFAFAGEALAGKYAGRTDNSSLQSLNKSLLLIGLCTAVIFSVIYTAGGSGIIQLLASDRHVVAIAHEYLPWAAAIPLCGFTAFVCDGILVGLIHTRVMLGAMAAAMLAFFTLYFTLPHSLGNNALWLSFDVYLLVRGGVELIVLARRCSKSNLQ